MVDSPLVSAARQNDVTIVDDTHTDESIPRRITQELPQLYSAGVRDLYLEHDARDVSLGELRRENSPYGEMIREAERLGIRVHLYDDRSVQRERAARFPEEAEFVRQNDPYFTNPEGLIAASPDPERMRAYIDETMNNRAQDIRFRNGRMVDNIADDMGAQPGGRALVLAGGEHVNRNNDVDEGLRARGYRTTTVEMGGVESEAARLERRAAYPDRPDFVIDTRSPDQVAAYKDPATGRMQQVMQGVELPWRNNEAIADVPREQQMQFSPGQYGDRGQEGLIQR